MKWYSIREYKPAVIGVFCFIRVRQGRIYVAKVESYSSNEFYQWVSEDNKYFDTEDVTHFCIPDPIEIE